MTLEGAITQEAQRFMASTAFQERLGKCLKEALTTWPKIAVQADSHACEACSFNHCMVPELPSLISTCQGLFK